MFVSDHDLEMMIQMARADIARHDIAAAKQGGAMVHLQMNDDRPENIKKQYLEMLEEGAHMEVKQAKIKKLVTFGLLAGVVWLIWYFANPSHVGVSKDLFECTTTVHKTMSDEPVYSQGNAVELCMRGHGHVLTAKCNRMDDKCWQ